MWVDGNYMTEDCGWLSGDSEINMQKSILAIRRRGVSMQTMKITPRLFPILALLMAPLALGDMVSDLIARAEKGELDAQVQLVELYTRGEAVPKDEAAAALWLAKAAALGDAGCQFKLGQRYLNGEGVKKDTKVGIDWLTKAAEQGNGDAQMTLGWLYFAGKGVMKNSEEAARWFMMSAQAGNAGAECQIGRMHMTGAGVTKDDVEAYKWARLAAAAGDVAANKLVFVLEQRMAPGDVVEGQIRFQDLQEQRKMGPALGAPPVDPAEPAIPVEPLVPIEPQ